jgi:hypothetical protein
MTTLRIRLSSLKMNVRFIVNPTTGKKRRATLMHCKNDPRAISQISNFEFSFTALHRGGKM